MPKQASHIKLIGSIDGLNYYKSRDGFIVRKKSSLSGSRIFRDPCFKRSRENLNEFLTTAKGNKLIRNSLRSLGLYMSERGLMNRLTKTLFSIIRSDAQNPRGERKIECGDLSQLNGFELNSNNAFTQAFSEPIKVITDRQAGAVRIIQEEYIPGEALKHPIEATHYRFIYGAVALDFDLQEFERSLLRGEMLLLDQGRVSAMTTILPIHVDTTLPVIVVIGMEYFQLSANGQFSLLQNGAYTSLTIIGVDQQNI